MNHFYHYVISAPDIMKRRKAQIDAFGAWGMRPHFFDAIMGNQLSSEQLEKVAAKENFLTVGEIGCALSHLGVYQKLLESREKCVYVFEDDALLTEDFINLQPQIQQFMEDQTAPTVLLLFNICGYERRIRRISQDVSIMKCLGGTRAYAYVLNRPAALNLLKAQMPVKIELDAWAIYQKMGFIRLYCLNKNVVQLNKALDEDSLIDNIDDRLGRDGKRVKRIKDKHVYNWYRQLTMTEKIRFFGRRISRHIKELYYENSEK
ncbi:glycosyltransferase family 25 protein [Acidaminococcus fermentans]